MKFIRYNTLNNQVDCVIEAEDDIVYLRLYEHRTKYLLGLIPIHERKKVISTNMPLRDVEEHETEKEMNKAFEAWVDNYMHFHNCEIENSAKSESLRKEINNPITITPKEL